MAHGLATSNGTLNKLAPDDRAIHAWYRFVLSFPPHLVADYLSRFGIEPGQTVLDPFCGTGTTLVESKKRRIASIGVEAHPMAALASRVKTTWTVDPEELLDVAGDIAEEVSRSFQVLGIDDTADCSDQANSLLIRRLSEERQKLLLANSISPLPLHKSLMLHDAIMTKGYYADHLRLALADTVVHSASNLEFGPEVGVGPPKPDSPVVQPWLTRVRSMANDLHLFRYLGPIDALVIQSDSREMTQTIKDATVDAVITSPPYPNEKDYTRTTRLESVLLGLLSNRSDLQTFKKGLLRSNTRGVYRGDDDGEWVADNEEVQNIAAAIETRRIELGKTSGFERMYPRVTQLYFGGMTRHFSALRRVLKPGARLAYVVGDQASYLRIMIRTGEILSRIAENLGYKVEGIDLFRKRRATSTREELREQVLLLMWPGQGGPP